MNFMTSWYYSNFSIRFKHLEITILTRIIKFKRLQKLQINNFICNFSKYNIKILKRHKSIIIIIIIYTEIRSGIKRTYMRYTYNNQINKYKINKFILFDTRYIPLYIHFSPKTQKSYLYLYIIRVYIYYVRSLQPIINVFLF